MPSWSRGFNLQLVQLVGRLWVFFLSHIAPGFQLRFYFHLCMWMVHWSLLPRLPWRIGFAPVRARCGGGAAAWVAEVLAAPGTQGSWQLRKKEIQCSKRAWQPVLANTLQYSFLDNTSPWQRKHGSPLSAGSKRVGHDQSNPACINARCFCLSQLLQWELTLKVVKLLDLQGTLEGDFQGHNLPPWQELWPYTVFFWASCNWWLEGLFGQSFSITLSIQALRGLPYLGSFSVVRCFRHIEGPSGWDPASGT